MNIGEWVRRHRSRAKWHFVESEIAGAAITHCGRRMEPEAYGVALDISVTMPLSRMIGQPQLCQRCI